MTDTEIHPEALRKSTPRAYDALISPHLPLLKRWVKKKAPNSIDSDDVIQQTLLLAIRHFGKFRFEASFGTWLCSIAMNEIRARLRDPENPRLTNDDSRILTLSDPCSSPLATLERKEANVQLHRAIAQLPEIYRVVVELRDFRELSTRETSKRLSISATAVKSRHYRARCQLLKALRGVHPADR